MTWKMRGNRCLEVRPNGNCPHPYMGYHRNYNTEAPKLLQACVRISHHIHPWGGSQRCVSIDHSWIRFIDP